MTRVTQILDKFSKPIINALLLLFSPFYGKRFKRTSAYLDPTRAVFLIFLVIISVDGDVYLNKVERCRQLH